MVKTNIENPVPNIKEARKFIKFVTIAEGGAMGDSGAIEFFCRLNGKNILYSGNLFYGEKIVDYNKLKKDFPKLNYMGTFIFPCDYCFRGWKYFNLGYGNNLYIATSVYPYFKILTEHMARHEVYASLYEYVFAILALLDKGFNKKKDFLEYFNKNVSKKKSLYTTVDINNRDNLHKTKGK